MTARANQGNLIIAVQFQPPNSLPTVNQGNLIMAVRTYPIEKIVEIGPPVRPLWRGFNAVPGIVQERE